MKKTWLAGIGMLVLLLAVIGVTGCSGDGLTVSGGSLELKGNLTGQQEGIWVSGTGKVYATPDVAILSLGIESQETTVAAAQANAAEAMDKVMDALKDEGVKEEDIQTQRFSIQKVTRWDSSKEQEQVIGYRVTNIVTAKVRDVEKAGQVIDSVAAAGGDLTRIDSIGFTVDDPTPYYTEARAQAMEYAKAKAEQLAGLAGMKLGKATYITESSYVPSPNYISRDYAMAEEAGSVPTTISAGELEITTNVNVAYELND